MKSPEMGMGSPEKKTPEEKLKELKTIGKGPAYQIMNEDISDYKKRTDGGEGVLLISKDSRFSEKAASPYPNNIRVGEIEIPYEEPTHGWRGDVSIGSIIGNAVQVCLRQNGFDGGEIYKGLFFSGNPEEIIRLAKLVPTNMSWYDLRENDSFKKLVHSLGTVVAKLGVE